MSIRHSIRHSRVHHTAIVGGIAAAIFGLGGCDTSEPEPVDPPAPSSGLVQRAPEAALHRGWPVRAPGAPPPAASETTPAVP